MAKQITENKIVDFMENFQIETQYKNADSFPRQQNLG